LATHHADTNAPAHDWLREARATMALAWPLVIAQLATIALQATDILMMGWLGPEYLGAGSLATAAFHPLLMFGVGVGMAVAPMVAQARGARDWRSVRRTTRQGLWIALGLSVVLTALLLNSEQLLRLVGQKDRTAALAGDYLRFAAWMVAPHLMFVVLRGLISAHGDTRIVLRITVFGIVLNAVLDYALILGHFGFPRLELRGAGLATSVVHVAMFLLLLRHVLRSRATRRYMILARFWRADWPRLRAILAMGAPIGLMMTAESGLFAVVAIMMGWLGPDELAGHAVALQLAAIAFMTPLGLSHATAVRVGLAFGAGDPFGAARAGWVSILASFFFMGAIAALFVALPGPLTGMFLDRADPGNTQALALAARFLLVAALFQVVDGAQVTAAAALRGIGDTRLPMMIALAGYWFVGIPVGWVLAFPLGIGGVGLWLGLAAGLSFAALFLCLRFSRLTARSPAVQGAA
jgi:MATE family multidrug resistance protein